MSGCGSLGFLYASGAGVAKDEVKAAAFYGQACTGGHMFGCQSQGRMYESGAGVPKDEARAFRLYTKACNGGEAPACDALKAMRAARTVR